MSNETPQRRLFRLLRRTVKDDQGRNYQEEHTLWLAHERAVVQTRESIDALGKLMSSLSRQRQAVEALSDRGRTLASRLEDCSKLALRDAELFERMGLVGLNAGLESARMGESVGRALAIVSEAIRAQSAQGVEGTRDLEQRLSDLRNEGAEVQVQLERVHTANGDISAEAARATTAASTAERSLSEIRERLKKATGSDPEVLKSIGEAAEHARALVGVLANLSGKVPQQLLAATLKPLLEPLLRMLVDDDAEDKDAL
jgi:hypothetical protein